MALYKYNKLIVELNGAMRLDRHPEVNAGWIDLFKDLRYSRRDRSTGPHGEYQDSRPTRTSLTAEFWKKARLRSWSDGPGNTTSISFPRCRP